MSAEEQDPSRVGDQPGERTRRSDREWLAGMLTALSVAVSQEEWERIFEDRIRQDGRPAFRVVKRGGET